MPGDLGSRGFILLETVITVIHCCHKGINIVRNNIDVYAKFWLYPLNVAPEIHSSDQATVFFQSSDHFGVRTVASVLLLADLSYTQRAICFKVRRVFRNALAHILVVTSRYLNNQAILWHHINTFAAHWIFSFSDHSWYTVQMFVLKNHVKQLFLNYLEQHLNTDTAVHLSQFECIW